MRPNRWLMLAAFLTCGSITGLSQGQDASAPELAPLPTLEELVAAAKVRAADVRLAQARLEERQLAHEEAVLGLLPSLSATGSYTRNQSESAITIPTSATSSQSIVVTPQDQLDAVFRVDLTLLDVPAIQRVRASDARVEAGTLSVAATADDVELATSTAYWERVAAEALERAARSALAAAEQNRALVTTRVAAELASDLDAARASASVERAKQTLAEATLARRIASRKLKTLTGLSTEGRAPALEADLERAFPMAPRTVVTARVAAAREEVRAAELDATGAWLSLVPKLSAYGQERFTNATGFGESPVWSLGLTATWRLSPAEIGASRSQAGRRRVALAEAERAAEDAEGAATDAALTVEARVASARAKRAEAVAAKKALEVARAGYLASTATSLEVVLAERDALAADVAAISADADLELARARFALATRGSAR